MYAKIGTGDPLLKLRWAIREIGEALAVAGGQTRNDTSDSADRLVNNLPMFIPESFDSGRVRSHEGLGDVEALSLN